MNPTLSALQITAIMVATLTASVPAQQTASRWIWYPEDAVHEAREQSRWFRHSFDLPGAPAEATLWLMVDDNQALWVNGEGPLEPEERDTAAAHYDLTDTLRAGENLLAVEAHNATSVAGVIARLTAEMPDGRPITVVSGAGWRVSREGPEGWNQPDFDDSEWQSAEVIGSAFKKPWFGHASFSTSHFITGPERAEYERFLAGLMAPPEQFADDPPLRAETGFVNGSAAMTLNGEARPLVMYRGTVDLMTEHGRRQVANFRDAGVHLYCPYVQIGTCWTGPEEYDFSAIDEQIRMYLALDPEAYLIVMVRLIQPPWWMEAHPDELVDYAVQGELGGDERFRAKRGSMASEQWLRDTGEAWRALIEHIEAQPWGKRVAGYHPGYGISAEWHYFGSWRDQYPDTGAAMTARFREWLRGKYATDEALQRAWADPDVTFESATVPGVQARKFGELIAFRDPEVEQRAIDYYRCHQRVVADALEHFGRIVRDTTDGAKICGAYYGYFFGVRPQTQGGHLDLQRLFDSPNLDYFVAPYSYSHRLMGQDGRLRSLAAAHFIGGTPHILEGDIRTYLHSANEYGRTENVTQSLAAVTREFSTALIERAGFWWVDFGPENEGGWFDDARIMERASVLQDVAERALHQPREQTAQVALVADLESFYYVSDGHGMELSYRLVEDIGTELHHAGAPFDTIHLDQLAEADLDRYRMLVFLNAFALDPDEAALITRLREAGEHAVVFLCAPGLITPDRVSLAQAETVTGLKLDLLEQWIPAQIDADVDDPLMQRLAPLTVHHLAPAQEIPIAGFDDAANWYNPRDEETMEQWYADYDTEAVEGGLRWSFDTGYSYTDIHWTAPEAFDPEDGVGFDLAYEGDAPTLLFTFVIKDAHMDEFVAPEQTLVDGQSGRMHWPLEAFESAPWSREEHAAPVLPLRGCKFVLRKTANVGRCVLEMRELSAIEGEVTERKVARYGSGAFAPALVPVGEDARTLGRIAGTDLAGIVAKGSGEGLTVYSATPFIPRQVLAAAMREAGVHRYIDETEDVLRADGRFIALHTATGGPRALRLPRAATVADALTGEVPGSGRALVVQTEPDSTMLLELEYAEAGDER